MSNGHGVPMKGSALVEPFEEGVVGFRGAALAMVCDEPVAVFEG